MKRKGKKQKTAGAAEERKVLSGVARSIDFFDSEDVTTKRGNPLLYCGRQLPLTPNFGFWERRSRFLPMATGLVIVYPPAWDAAAAPSAVNPRAPELSDAMREAKRLWARTSSNHFVMVVILSISYPVDILRAFFKALAKPFAALLGPRRNRGDARTASDYGARSVKRVGFSLSRSVTIVDEGSTLAYHASPLRWRPWFMYAPGLTLLYRATEAAFEAVAAGATRTLKRLKAAEQEGKNATAADDAELANATAARREAPGPLRRLERRTAEACLDATSGLRAWCDSKTSLLGYSVLPYMAHLTDGDDVEPVGFKPWQGSVLFMMRPFDPARPFG
ncbi:enoyl-CoA hydratase [Aureococcus anophagefferens]|nr:enoyl-CoA hydratase [Aureococcus anophagefferens]